MENWPQLLLPIHFVSVNIKILLITDVLCIELRIKNFMMAIYKIYNYHLMFIYVFDMYLSILFLSNPTNELSLTRLREWIRRSDRYSPACKNESDGLKIPLRTAKSKTDGWIDFLQCAGKEITVWLTFYSLQERIRQSEKAFTDCRKQNWRLDRLPALRRKGSDGQIGTLLLAGTNLTVWKYLYRQQKVKLTVGSVSCGAQEKKLRFAFAPAGCIR